MVAKFLLVAFSCAMASATISRVGRAQSNVVLLPGTASRPTAEDWNVTPHPVLLPVGIATLAFSYLPSVGVGLVSDHKGDTNLIIPLAGPWIDLASRGCDGFTLPGPNGPFQLSDGQYCGTSGVERAALIADGIAQGIGALTIVGAFLIPQRRTVLVGDAKAPAILSMRPSSFGGRGAGAVLVGSF